MKIRFRQSGGVADLVWGCEIDTRALPRAEAAEIENLVRGGGVLKRKLKDRITRPRGAACDIFGYSISVVSSDITYSVSFDDLTIPEGCGPLVACLKKHARRQT